MNGQAGGADASVAPKLKVMRQLLDDYEKAMKPGGVPADARDAAYQMTQLLSALYAVAYTAAAARTGREGKGL